MGMKRLLVALFAVSGCMSPARELPIATPSPTTDAPNCAWSVSVADPPLRTHGDHCDLRELVAPAGVVVGIVLDAEHYLEINTIDMAPSTDGIPRHVPSLVIDGVYVPCGSGVAGTMTIEVGNSQWSADADFRDCAQASVVHVAGLLAVVH